MNDKIIDFLQQSNFIEGVYDEDSLIQARYAWEYLVNQSKITSDLVLKTHKILMLHQKLYPNEIGYFRKAPIWIGGREGKPFYALPNLIEEWCKRMNTTLEISYKRLHAATMSQSLHVHYESIHPFIDGNGRTGRMFMNWWRIKKGLPILVIKESKKHEYYQWFV